MLPKILVVDDTVANLVAMRRLLTHSGAEIIEARSGNEALALCLDHQFALILLDVNMPDMDGFEVAALLGEAEQLRETPIIFVTAAYADDLNRLKGYRSGAVDYIAKPINDVILQSKVRVFLELYAVRAKLLQTLTELAERNQQLTREVAERELAEATVRHQASHDILTGLPNRMLFRDRLQVAIQRAHRHHGRFALAFIDIDGFKGVNDEHGHPVGDALLQEISARLSAHLRGNDTVARLGGDEFALVLEDIDDPQQALQLSQKLCTALGEPYTLRGDGAPVEVRVSASIGIAPYLPDDRPDADERLIQAADRGMYAAKRSGKNRCMLATG
ncbi:diguanylate cyclase domain-containing protein [Rhodanobacter umsongensis]|uniref:Diguanylate cyclase domain-containing protein n=1 Tax=Rhodanobacter umsongensis TaxID=633153 RepID=A0ABW0JMC7_9GAMM